MQRTGQTLPCQAPSRPSYIPGHSSLNRRCNTRGLSPGYINSPSVVVCMGVGVGVNLCSIIGGRVGSGSKVGNGSNVGKGESVGSGFGVGVDNRANVGGGLRVGGGSGVGNGEGSGANVGKGQASETGAGLSDR